MPPTDSKYPPAKPPSSASETFDIKLLGAGGSELSFPAPAAQTVLQSALAAGHELLSACRNGTCRACLRQLHSGQVRYKIAWPGLSAEEKVEGFMLPCVAYPESDLVIQAHTT